MLTKHVLKRLHTVRQPSGRFASYRYGGFSGVPGPLCAFANLVQRLVARLGVVVLGDGPRDPVDPSGNVADPSWQLPASRLARPGCQRRVCDKLVECVQQSEVAIAVEGGQQS